MKKNLNVIQINGLRGIAIAAFVVTCLIAGFIVFPGLVAMKLWNIAAGMAERVPVIGIIQGVLLWGIILASYFTFRKTKHIVCIKSADGLNEEELKAIFADMKQQAKDDIFIKNMFKAQEAELKIRNLSESKIPRNDNKTEKSNQTETVQKP